MYKCDFKTDFSGEFLRDAEKRLIPVTDESGKIIPVLDNNGRLQPRYPENYTQQEIEQIHYLLGENPQIRFSNNEAIYFFIGYKSNFPKLSRNSQHRYSKSRWHLYLYK